MSSYRDLEICKDSNKGEKLYQDIKIKYETLSKKIYKYIRWVENEL
jgi:hypothetical protein